MAGQGEGGGHPMALSGIMIAKSLSAKMTHGGPEFPDRNFPNRPAKMTAVLISISMIKSILSKTNIQFCNESLWEREE